MKEVIDHGEYYDLTNYSPILVAGEDRYGFNQSVSVNLNGYPYRLPRRLKSKTPA